VAGADASAPYQGATIPARRMNGDAAISEQRSAISDRD